MDDAVLHVRWDGPRDEWVVLEEGRKPRKIAKDLRFSRKRDAEAKAREILSSRAGGEVIVHSVSETISERVHVPAAAAV